MSVTAMPESADAATERAIILASARLLVDRIAAYTELMAQWGEEESADDAEQ